MRLCRAPSKVVGAELCPREAGHRGPCYWWIPFCIGQTWHVLVYSGEPYDRVGRARGRFCDVPTMRDVADLLETVGDIRAREAERRAERRRTPQPPAPPAECVPWEMDVVDDEVVITRTEPAPAPLESAATRAARLAAHRARAALR